LRLGLKEAGWDPYLQGVAMEALGKSRSSEDIGVMRAHLGPKEDWADWRWQKALLGLGWTRDADAAPPLFEHLGSSYPQRIRATAALALGRLGKHHDTLGVLVREKLCEDLGSKGMREQLGRIGGLVALGDAAAIPALQRLRKSASDGRVMRVAYEACVRLGEQASGSDALASDLERLRAELEKVNARIERLESP
jgi:HEAT repeat protein